MSFPFNTTLTEEDILQSIARADKPSIPPFERLPCANPNKSVERPCGNEGTRLCSRCRLVAYCSTTCQQEHWKSHKNDCKHPIISQDWQPAYIREMRRPIFYTGGDALANDFRVKREDRYSQGMPIWGNTPSVDVLNLSLNEKDSSRDYKLAFIASGDLRNVVHTVCDLPEDYSGKLTILMNDKNPIVMHRNIMLLLILGFVSQTDVALAADMAIHFWYSITYPPEYQSRLQGALAALAQHTTTHVDDVAHGVVNFPLGPRSRLNFLFNFASLNFLEFFTAPSTFSTDDITSEYSSVRSAPSREDYRGRMYSGMRPAHRMAFHRYRENGLVLPFGAPCKHFTSVNSSLFSHSGTWMQTDYANPLGGYSPEEVIRVGKAHGAPPEDVYGCLYFYLSDQLREFARRLQNMKISIHVFGEEAIELSQKIQQGKLSTCGIPPSVKFDRIDVSNIIDENYVGLGGPIKAWAPFLSTQPKVTLHGHLMNWVHMGQPDGEASHAGEKVMMRLLDQMQKEKRIPKPDPSASAQQRFLEAMNFRYLYPNMMQTVYDNSRPFEEFLKKHSLPSILRQMGLVRKKQHTITPYRLLSPLTETPASLPKFPGDSWYTEHQLGSHTWLERLKLWEYKILDPRAASSKSAHTRCCYDPHELIEAPDL